MNHDKKRKDGEQLEISVSVHPHKKARHISQIKSSHVPLRGGASADDGGSLYTQVCTMFCILFINCIIIHI